MESPSTPETLRVRVVTFDDARVQRLVEEVQAEYVILYGGPDDTPMDPAEFAPPHGRFALGTLGDTEAAMGGWRRRPDLDARLGTTVAEVKRMYVAPAARRRGHAAELLAFLEDSARSAGVGTMVLETGVMQPAAIAMYEAAGYEPTVRFGHYADSPTARYFAKRLANG